MPMEYIIPSLPIAAMIGMADCGALEERLAQLEELEDERFWLDSINRYRSSRKNLGMITISSFTCSKKMI